MGGNSRAVDLSTGNVKLVKGRLAFAERIDLRKVDVCRLRADISRTLSNIDDAFFEKFDFPLWPAKTDFFVGHCFMGSARHLCDKLGPDENDLVRHMPMLGDIDVAVPEKNLELLWQFLTFLEAENGLDEMTYLGQNRTKLRKPSINAVFDWNGIFLQIDFVGTNVLEKTGDVDPFVNFAHSSSWEDRKKGIKGVAHKYLLQTLAWAVSYDPNVIILTDKSPLSPPEKVRVKTMHEPPRPMSFSVDRGVRMRLEQQFGVDGKPLVVLGQNAYKEVPTSASRYIADLENIFMILFGLPPAQGDMDEFGSFCGLIQLCKKYLDASVYEQALDFMFRYKLYGTGQALSRDSADEDRRIKERICEVVREMTFLKVHPDTVKEYYKTYKEREVTE